MDNSINIKNIEVRKLTKDEFNRLFAEAPDTETRNLKAILGEWAYQFFQERSLEQEGLVINKRPIYFGAVAFNRDKETFNLWTMVNSNVREQFTLFKVAKRTVYKWLKKFGVLYATMEKINTKNIEWTKRLGFKTVYEDDRIITLKLGG